MIITSVTRFLFCWLYPGVVEVETTHAKSPDVQCHCLSTLKTFYLCSHVVRALSAAWTFVFPLRREWRQDLQQISACAARVTTCNFQTYLPQLLHAKFAKNHEKYIFTNLTNILRISFKLSLHNFPLSGCWVQNLAIYAATSDPVARSHQARHIKDNNNPEFCVTYHNISPVSQSINVTDLLHAPVCSLFQHTSKFLPLNYHLGLCNWVKLSQKLTEKSLVRHDPIPCLYWITRPG